MLYSKEAGSTTAQAAARTLDLGWTEDVVFFGGCFTPWKTNVEPTNNHLERKMIFQTSMSMFHVNLPGCTC